MSACVDKIICSRASQEVSDDVLLELNEATEATELARFRALKKKTMLAIMCPNAGKLKFWAFEELGSLCNVILLGSKKNKYVQKLLASGVVKGVIEADVESDGDSAIKNAIEAIHASGVSFDGVMSLIEFSIPIASAIAEHFGMVANSSKAVATARNKFQAREACKKAGIKTCRYAFIRSMEEMAVAANIVGYPAIVKPASGAKSEGVFKVHSNEELRVACDKLFADFKVNTYTNYNPGVEDCHYVLMEQFITGEEFDIDVLLCRGKLVFSSVNDNWETLPPYFLETGSNVPSLLSDEKQQQLTEYSVACALAMGFTDGCLHIESKWDDVDGPMLIEVNARLGGGPAREFNKDVWGVDLFEQWVLSCAGIAINPVKAERPKLYSSHYLINAPYTGTLDSVKFIQEISKLGHVVYSKPLSAIGDKVVGPDTGIPTWVGEFRVDVTTSPQDAVDTVKNIVQSLAYSISPAAPTGAAVRDEFVSKIDLTVG